MSQINSINPRWISALGVLLAVASLAFAIGYLQNIEYLDPCPLCILDRGVVIALGSVFLLALLMGPGRVGRRILAAIAGLLSCTGIAICVRHIYLQNLPPDQVPECGAGFWYSLESMPFAQFLDTIFNGSGECADIQWQLFGLSLPQLTLILFVDFLLLSVLLYINRSTD